MEELFRVVLNMSLTGAFVILAVMLLRLPLKKAPKWISYALWAIVLFRLLCPVSFESPFALLPSAEVVPSAILSAEPAIQSGVKAVDEALNPVLMQALSPEAGASANPVQVIFSSWGWVWAAGVFGMLLYALIDTLRFYTRIRFATRVCDQVFVSDRIDTAFVFGLIRPRIYLPAGLSEEQCAHILRHESTHIRRLDHVSRPLAFLALALHWFNPLVWLAYRLSGRDMELSCDESVLKQAGNDIRKAYSETLLTVSTRRSGLLAPLAFGENNTKGRIKNVLHYKKPVFWVLLLALVAAVAIGLSLLANPVQEEGLPVEDPQGGLTASYSLTHMGETGEIFSMPAPLPDEGEFLAKAIIMDYVAKSSVFPGVDVAGLTDYYVIRQNLSGEIHDYYAFQIDGIAVLQSKDFGVYSRISDELYAQLAAFMQGLSTEPDDAGTALDASALAQSQSERLSAHLKEFSELPRSEDGFESAYSDDWDGDGKPDEAYLQDEEDSFQDNRQHVTVAFGDGASIVADAIALEGMSEWGRDFLIEAADLTGDGQNEILLLIDLGGQGGHGSYGLYIYRKSGGGWILMDAPHHGYELLLHWKENVATVSSGNYSEVVADAAVIRAHYMAKGEETIWEEVDGKEYYNAYAADAPCDIALVQGEGKTLVKISQYITGMTGAHVDGLGYLVTTLEWDESGAYTVADMYFVLCPQ